MRSSMNEILSRLCCPDDQQSLRSGIGALECSHCRRKFPVQDGDILEILPDKPAEPWSNPEYAANYSHLFYKDLENREEETVWGLGEKHSQSWKLHRERQLRAVFYLLQRDRVPLRDLILCDVSAGVGDYTLTFARHFKLVLHCDLSVDALRYASAKSRQMSLDNVLFLRVDYCALPFSRSLDRLLCIDTLIRGEDHEKILLVQLQKVLSAQGRAIIDFHNWWHNPPRRLGLLPENFGNNRSYSRTEAEGLMRVCGINNWKLTRFHQEFEPGSQLAKRLSWFLPATRLVYEIGSDHFSSQVANSLEHSFSADSGLHPSEPLAAAAKDERGISRST